MKQTTIRFTEKEWDLIKKIQKDNGLPSFACAVRHVLKQFDQDNLSIHKLEIIQKDNGPSFTRAVRHILRQFDQDNSKKGCKERRKSQ